MRWDNIEILPVSTREQLREWLMKNHKVAREAWIIMSRKPKKGTILYLDIVEEALCFGWIDGINKKLDEKKHVQRITPRKSNNWTELNKERVRRLERIGLMTDAGRAVLPDMSTENFIIASEIWKEIRDDEKVLKNFKSFPALYIRVRIGNIQQEIKHPIVYKRRLNKFLDMTREGRMYGAWNDDGKLLNE